jgi:hypothetical protein
MTDPDASPHHLMYEAIARAEQQLVQTFERDVGAELEIADRAEALLALVMSSVDSWTGTIQVDDDGAPVGGDVPKLILLALQYIGARALRSCAQHVRRSQLAMRPRPVPTIES